MSIINNNSKLLNIFLKNEINIIFIAYNALNILPPKEWVYGKKDTALCIEKAKCDIIGLAAL